MRYILERPDYEFFPTLAEHIEMMNMVAGRNLSFSIQQGGVIIKELPKPYPHYSEPIYVVCESRNHQPLFSIQLLEENSKGLLVDIQDKIGLLSDMRKGTAYMETNHLLNGLESPVVVGPFDVLDANLLMDCILSRLYSKQNIDTLGLKGTVPFEDYSVDVWGPDGDTSITLRQIEEELSSRDSMALKNWNLYDVLFYAKELGDIAADQYPEDITKDRSLVEQLCDAIEGGVIERDNRWKSKDFPYSFITVETNELLKIEQHVISKADSLKGVKRSKDLGGKLLGRSDGFDVVIKNRPGGEMLPGNDRFISIMKDGKAVGGYVNLVRGNVDEPQWRIFKGVLDDVWKKALKRDQKLEKYEKFRNAIGLRSNSPKIK